jgi:hypothetical protein
MVKRRLFSRLASDEITTCGYWGLTYKVYNCHDSCAYSYKRSRIISRLVGMGWDWYDFDLACVESYDL